jgi:hypothetical protein
VHWHNSSHPARLPRRQSACRVRYETTFYAWNGLTDPWSKANSPSLHQNQGDSKGLRVQTFSYDADAKHLDGVIELVLQTPDLLEPPRIQRRRSAKSRA